MRNETRDLARSVARAELHIVQFPGVDARDPRAFLATVKCGRACAWPGSPNREQARIGAAWVGAV
jgi:hypothetical protein